MKSKKLDDIAFFDSTISIAEAENMLVQSENLPSITILLN